MMVRASDGGETTFWDPYGYKAVEQQGEAWQFVGHRGVRECVSVPAVRLLRLVCGDALEAWDAEERALDGEVMVVELDAQREIGIADKN